MDIVGPITEIGLFIVAVIGGLVIWELKRVHTRIDKYAQELDIHIAKGVKIYTDIEHLNTTVALHVENGFSHVHKE